VVVHQEWHPLLFS